MTAGGVAAAVEKTPSNASTDKNKTPEQMAKKRLAKFIASFREGSGIAPPTRSWRNLLLLSEFQEFFDKMRRAQKDVDLQNIKSEMKVFKAALNDLVNLTKASVTSLEKAINTQTTKKAAKETAAKSGQGKQIKAARTVMDFVAENGVSITRKEYSSITVAIGDTNYLSFT